MRVLAPGRAVSHGDLDDAGSGGVRATLRRAHLPDHDLSIWVMCNRLSNKHELADDTNRTSVLHLDAATGRTRRVRTVPGGTVGAVTEAGGAAFVPDTLVGGLVAYRVS